MKHLLMIGAGIMGRGYVEAARRLSMRVTLIDSATNRSHYEPLVDRFVECADPSDEGWIGAALDAVSDCTPDAALGFSEPQVLAAAWIQSRYGLPGPSLEAAQASRDKALQRTLFARAEVGQPGYRIVQDAESGLGWAATRYPVVLKPLRGAGSHGVQLLRDACVLERKLEELLPGGAVLLEEYVDAPELSWEGLVRHGDILFGNYTRKRTSGPPQFVELGHTLPCRLSSADRDRFDARVRRVVSAMGIQTSLVHLEFRTDDRFEYVMEVAVRTPGDYLMDMLSLAYDHDFYESVVRLAADEPLSPPGPVAAFAGISFITARARSFLDDGMVRQTAARKNVVRIDVATEGWGSGVELQRSEQRLGHVLAVGDSEDVVAQELATIMATSIGAA